MLYFNIYYTVYINLKELIKQFLYTHLQSQSMRYLTCIKPAEGLTEKLMNDPELRIPSSGIHCTLWGFNIWEKDESQIIDVLSYIKVKPFSISISRSDIFDNNSYVLILKKNEELCRLHANIVKEVRLFDKNLILFDDMVNRYGLEKYNPHITISKYFIPTKQKTDYEGLCMLISCYHLLKKKNGIWEEVSVFNLE